MSREAVIGGCIVSSLMVFGCWKGQDLADIETDDGPVESDSGGDVDPDGDVDSDSATDVDAETDADTATDSDPETTFQEPIQIRITNDSGNIAFISGRVPVSISFLGGTPGERRAFAPSCMLHCEEVTDPAVCCIECADYLTTLVVHPGDTVVQTWSGRLYEVNGLVCPDCNCYEDFDPFVGEYRLGVRAYDDVECYDNLCEIPSVSGIAYDMEPTGESLPYETRIEVPYEGAEPRLVITGHDTVCDDGTIPSCDVELPVCDSNFEILAYRDDCYVCVNPWTCKPWGEPGCETDEDCSNGSLCRDCGTSSCPACSDCLKACVPHPTQA